MIPVIDCRNDISAAGDEILQVLETVGFAYLKNFGISQDEVDNIFNLSRRFWIYPPEIKNMYARAKHLNAGNTGYVAPSVEMLDPTNKAEIREAYNLTPQDIFDETRFSKVPNDIVPGFGSELITFFRKCHHLSMEILNALAVALKIKDTQFFSKTHELLGYGANSTTLRLLHYPGLPVDIEDGTARCGEHTDYGTITLLFQDDVGGLEVRQRDGTFVQATPIQDTLLLNSGDLLQRWTSDRLTAAKHRVLVPKDRSQWERERCSLAFFVHPDDHCVVKPWDGSDTYTPVTARQYLLDKFSKTY